MDYNKTRLVIGDFNCCNSYKESCCSVDIKIYKNNGTLRMIIKHYYMVVLSCFKHVWHIDLKDLMAA